MKLFLSLFAISIISSFSYAQDLEKLFEEKKPAVALINSGGGVCSGSLIEAEITLTAAHCVDRLYTPYVVYGKTEYKSAIVAMDRDLDLALIRHLPVKDVKPVPIKKAKEKLKQGQKLATIGHPLTPKPFANPPFSTEFSYLMSQGILSGKNSYDLITDMSLSPGNSGGPIFDEKGEQVGVVSRKRIDMGVGNIGVGAHHESIHSFLKDSKKDFVLPWFFAKTSGFGNITYNTLSADLAPQGIDSYGLWTFDIGLNFFQRLDSYWKIPLHKPENLDDFYEFRMAYHLRFEMANHTYLLLSPIYGWARLNEEQSNSLGVQISHSALPLSLRYVSYDKTEALGDIYSWEFSLGSSF